MSRRTRFKPVLPRVKPGTDGISAPSAVKRVTAFLDRCPKRMADLDALMESPLGAPRLLNARSFFAIAIALGLLNRPAHLTQMTKLANELGPGQRTALALRRKNRKPVSYRQFEHFLALLARAFSLPTHNHLTLDTQSGLIVDPNTGEVICASVGVDEVTIAGVTECTTDCPASRNLEDLFNRIMGDAWEVFGLPMPDAVAVDSYVLETHFGAKSWGGKADIDPQYVPESDKPARARLRGFTAKKKSGTGTAAPSRNATAAQKASLKRQRAAWEAQDHPVTPPHQPNPIGPTAAGNFTRSDPTFPQIGPDGRLHHTIDPDAALGYRGAGRSRHSGFANGRDYHSVVATGFFPDGTPSTPMIIAFATCPAGSNKTEPTLTAFRRAGENGLPSGTTVTLDRAYTSGPRESFEGPLEAMGFRAVKSLVAYQREALLHTEHVVMVDGYYFTTGMPETMLALKAVERNDPIDTRAKKTKKFDIRSAYAFQIHAEDSERIRFRGPCTVADPVRDRHGRLTSWRKGRLTVRCPNHPDFNSMPRHLPKTTCEPNTPCGCSSTFTVNKAALPSAYTPVLFQTTAWHEEFGPRALVETANATLLLHKGEGRHHYRVIGRKWDVMHGLWKVGALLHDIHMLMLRLEVPNRFTLDPEHIRPVVESLGTPNPENDTRKRRPPE